MNCTDFLAKLTDFFDETIDPSLLPEIREHLGACHHCEVVVDTTRHTIDFYRAHEHHELPDELADRLRGAIIGRCQALGKDKKHLKINSH